MTQARNLSRLLNKKLETFKFTATSGQTTFSDSDDAGNILSYTPENMLVTYNGVVLESGSEYTATNGTSVVLDTGADSAAEVNVYAFESVSLGGYVPSTGGTFGGPIVVPSGASGNQVAQVQEVVKKTGDTMTGALNFNNVVGEKINLYKSTAGSGDWYGVDVNNNELRLFSGAAGLSTGGVLIGKRDNSTFTEHVRIRNDGILVNSLKPYAFVRVSGSPSYGTGGVAPYDDVIESQNLSWNTTSKGFTVPITGIYQITAAMRLDTYNGDYLYYIIRANGAALLSNPHFLGQPRHGGNFGTVSVATSVKLVANDFVDFTWAWNGSSPLPIYVSQSYVSVALLG